MSSPQRATQIAETSRFPRTAPAYCAIAAVAVLLLAGISTSAAAVTADADASLSHDRAQSAPGRLATPKLPTAPQPEAAPSASSTPIGLDLPITPTVATPDTGAVGSGGGGAIELALAVTGDGQDVVWRAHVRGILANENDRLAAGPLVRPASPGFDPIWLLPLGGALVFLGALLALVAIRSRIDDFDDHHEPAPTQPAPPQPLSPPAE